MKSGFKSLLNSFKYAFKGIGKTILSERNMRIHFTITVLIAVFLPFYKLTAVELILLALTISAVMSAELINTAIERAVDASVKERNPIAAFSKDAAAGAVLISAIASVIVGFILFFKVEVFRRILDFSKANLWFPAIVLVFVILGFIFIFCNYNNDKE